jgi:hypothetical protein
MRGRLRDVEVCRGVGRGGRVEQWGRVGWKQCSCSAVRSMGWNMDMFDLG